jgi:hypothetical protein
MPELGAVYVQGVKYERAFAIGSASAAVVAGGGVNVLPPPPLWKLGYPLPQTRVVGPTKSFELPLM